jgi:carboxyl-terminal processing protease
LVLLATFGFGVGIGRQSPPPADSAVGTGRPTATTDPSDEDDLALIREAWNAIQEHYVDAADLDDRELAYAAIDGLTEAVGDTGHTEFMSPEEREQRKSALSGSYVGIGAEVDTTDEALPLVVGVFRDSPADKAGLRAGDVITAVDGRPTAGDSLDDVIATIRGEAGTAVVLTVRPESGGDEREIRIVRADVQIEPVSWAMVPGTTTAMLRLEQFSSGAAAKLRTAIDEARDAGAERLVFDLRGNPGGYVNEAVAVASEFLAFGTVYVERNADGEENRTKVKEGGRATDLPLVVLIDGGSASAAEIVSGAIQDAGRGQLVGEQTFGTGTVLAEVGLSDGSALRIGTVEWLTPNGRVIWHEGIAPDEVVERPDDVEPIVPEDLAGMTESDVARLADPQLRRALELFEATAVRP